MQFLLKGRVPGEEFLEGPFRECEQQQEPNPPEQQRPKTCRAPFALVTRNEVLSPERQWEWI